MRILLILLLLASPAMAQSSWPVVYYDPATGDDANPGTKAAPVKTMAKAQSLLAGAGQIVSTAGTTTYTGAGRYVPTPAPLPPK